MDRIQRPSALTDYETTLIHQTAIWLVGEAGFTPSDVPDITQELTVHVLQHLHEIDLTKAKRKTFVAKWVRQQAWKLIRHNKREMRDYRRRARPLRKTVEAVDADGNECVDVPEEELHDLRTGRQAGSEIPQANLRLDVAQLLAGLPANLRAVAAMMMDGRSQNEIANALGISRRALRSREMVALRGAFRAREDSEESHANPRFGGPSN